MRAKGSNCVIDISHHNGAGLRFDKAKSDGILGVIQKATQGKTYVDATFKKNKKAILAEGLLFGAYHFGDGSDGKMQAKHFLNVVQPDDDTVIVLDFETNPAGRFHHDFGSSARLRHPRQSPSGSLARIL